jgi:hypothetical protein
VKQVCWSGCTSTFTRPRFISAHSHSISGWFVIAPASAPATPTAQELPSLQHTTALTQPRILLYSHLQTPTACNSTSRPITSRSNTAHILRRVSASRLEKLPTSTLDGPGPGRRHVSRAVEHLRRCCSEGDGRESYQRELGVHTGTAFLLGGTPAFGDGGRAVACLRGTRAQHHTLSAKSGRLYEESLTN